MLVLNASNETLRKHTWGLDLSQTVHGAGGIGGLLAAYETQGTTTTDDDKSYWFLYDGNGNVGQVLATTKTDGVITGVSSALAAAYEYDPYGNVIVSSGDYANANPFRFSTKWLDTELATEDQTGAIGEDGLYYYGYRYYSPRLGRWLNRDPIGDEGALLLMDAPESSRQGRLVPLEWNSWLLALTNNPVMTVDPDGRLAVTITAAIIGGGCLLGAAIINAINPGCDPGDMKTIDAQFPCWEKCARCETGKKWQLRDCKITLRCKNVTWPWPNEWVVSSNSCALFYGMPCAEAPD